MRPRRRWRFAAAPMARAPTDSLGGIEIVPDVGGIEAVATAVTPADIIVRRTNRCIGDRGS